MNDHRIHHLRPLPECENASQTLRQLNVDTHIPIGWAPTCLALATTIQAARPGIQLHLRPSGRGIRIEALHGTVIANDNNFDAQIGAWIIADHTLALTCAHCGRPGLPRLDHTLSICDACRYLETHPNTQNLPFTPSLPLPEEALTAIETTHTLKRPERFADLPAGWARLALSTVRDMPTPELATTARFHVHDDTVSVAFDDEAIIWSSDLLTVNERLEVNARVHCRRCSRRLTSDPDNPSHSTICPGCRWVASRGWEIARPSWTDVEPTTPVNSDISHSEADRHGTDTRRQPGTEKRG